MMKKSVIAATAVSMLFSVSACSTATQTGGGTSEDASTASGDNPVSFAPVPGTVEALSVADVKNAGWLAGTAKPKFKAASTGNVDVVASGPISTSQIGASTVPIAIRNNTDTAMSNVSVTGAAKDDSGKIVGSGESQGVHPAVIPPGGVSLGFVYYQSEIPADSAVDFTVASQPVEGEPYFRDLKMDQANLVNASITGQATNSSDDILNGPYGVTVFCFDEANKLLSSHGGFASPDAEIAPKQTVTFEVPLFDATCPTFLAGVSGYGPLG